MKVVLERYHGLSNDYVVFDPNKNGKAIFKPIAPAQMESWKVRL